MNSLSIVGSVSQIRYGSDVVRYTVRTSQARRSDRVSIHVEANGRVFVDASQNASNEDIRRAVTKRIAWISRHVEAAEQRLALVTPREYVSGETVYYLGRRYRLKVVESDTEGCVAIRGAYIEVTVKAPTSRKVRALLTDWYQSRAKAVINERFANLCNSLRWVKFTPPVAYRRLKVQWGSCSPNGRITLNAALIKAPSQCIDYVLLHELCHLRHHNHGEGFYRLLKSHLPEWPSVKSRLDGMADAILAE